MGKNEVKHGAHSTWRCEYHIVFAPKYRRKVVYGEIKADIGVILRKLCEEKKVEILEAEACPDHIHMLVSIPPYLSVSQFMGFLKGKSSLMIFDRHAELNWHVGFDVLNDQTQLSDHPELFSHDLTLEALHVVGGKGFSLLFMSTKDSMDKNYQVTVTGENGDVLAEGELDRNRVTPYSLLTQYDSMEEMMDDIEDTIRRENDVDFYGEELVEQMIQDQQKTALYMREGEYYIGLKLDYTGQPIPLLSHLTVTVSDPDTGEEIYATTLRLERKET